MFNANVKLHLSTLWTSVMYYKEGTIHHLQCTNIRVHLKAGGFQSFLQTRLDGNQSWNATPHDCHLFHTLLLHTFSEYCTHTHTQSHTYIHCTTTNTQFYIYITRTHTINLALIVYKLYTHVCMHAHLSHAVIKQCITHTHTHTHTHSTHARVCTQN